MLIGHNTYYHVSYILKHVIIRLLMISLQVTFHLNFLGVFHLAVDGDLSIDPTKEFRNSGINAWVTSAGTANAKANHTLEGVTVGAFRDEWSARVTLARVLATCAVTSADHDVWVDPDASFPVAVRALLAADGRHTDLQEDAGGVIATLAGQAPTGHSGFGAIRHLFASSWQANWLNSGGEVDRGVQHYDGDIILGGL